jgi:hypothetical protein
LLAVSAAEMRGSLGDGSYAVTEIGFGTVLHLH